MRILRTIWRGLVTTSFQYNKEWTVLIECSEKFGKKVRSLEFDKRKIVRRSEQSKIENVANELVNSCNDIISLSLRQQK